MRKERKINTMPLEVIEKWLRDSDCDVRTAAMNACQGRDVPFEVIEKGLRDSDRRVRTAAMNACQKNNIPVPNIRTFEPPENVYKKCLGGVIVVAHIPDDAEVRGTPGRKCRASKAVITDIIGDFCGEKVGISIHDISVCYCVGDEVETDDFGPGFEACSQGFHFFCTEEQARAYH